MPACANATVGVAQQIRRPDRGADLAKSSRGVRLAGRPLFLARVGQAQRVIQLAVGQQPSIGSERGPRNCIRNRASAHLYPLHPLGLPLPPLFIPRKLLNFNPKPPQVRSKSLLHLGNAGLKRFAIATGVALIAPLSANAEVFVSGQVTMLEASYLPNAAGFVLDAGYSGCPPGDLSWTPKMRQ